MARNISNKDMEDLSLPELRQLLNRHNAKKQRLSDAVLEARSELGFCTTDIHNIRRRIGELDPKEAPVEITDHSVVRYLERVKGVDINAIRKEMDSSQLRECVKRCYTGHHRINGVTYVTEHKTLVTVFTEEGLQFGPTNPTDIEDQSTERK
jgi:hypothetical protein